LWIAGEGRAGAHAPTPGREHYQSYEPFSTNKTAGRGEDDRGEKVTLGFFASQGKDSLGRTPLHLAASILNPAFLPVFSQLVRQCPQAVLAVRLFPVLHLIHFGLIFQNVFID